MAEDTKNDTGKDSKPPQLPPPKTKRPPTKVGNVARGTVGVGVGTVKGGIKIGGGVYSGGQYVTKNARRRDVAGTNIGTPGRNFIPEIYDLVLSGVAGAVASDEIVGVLRASGNALHAAGINLDDLAVGSEGAQRVVITALSALLGACLLDTNKETNQAVALKGAIKNFNAAYRTWQQEEVAKGNPMPPNCTITVDDPRFPKEAFKRAGVAGMTGIAAVAAAGGHSALVYHALELVAVLLTVAGYNQGHAVAEVGKLKEIVEEGIRSAAINGIDLSDKFPSDLTMPSEEGPKAQARAERARKILTVGGLFEGSGAAGVGSFSRREEPRRRRRSAEPLAPVPYAPLPLGPGDFVVEGWDPNALPHDPYFHLTHPLGLGPEGQKHFIEGYERVRDATDEVRNGYLDVIIDTPDDKLNNLQKGMRAALNELTRGGKFSVPEPSLGRSGGWADLHPSQNRESTLNNSFSRHTTYPNLTPEGKLDFEKGYGEAVEAADTDPNDHYFHELGLQDKPLNQLSPRDRGIVAALSDLEQDTVIRRGGRNRGEEL